MFGLCQVFDESNLFDFLHVIEAARAQDIPQYHFLPFREGDAFLHGRIDDFGMSCAWRHATQSSKHVSRSPCFLWYYIDWLVTLCVCVCVCMKERKRVDDVDVVVVVGG